MSKQGRFPANLLVSDDVLDDGKITKSTPSKVTAKAGFGANTNDYGNNSTTWSGGYTLGAYDKGTYSRFFSLDAWAELHVGDLEEVVQRNLPFLIVPKASKKEKTGGCGKNNHPTVKPIKLMSYLITMGSRPGDVVLDPFAGSGSTGCAAVAGQRNYIMIEMSEEYVEIIKARIEHYEDQMGLFNPPKEAVWKR